MSLEGRLLARSPARCCRILVSGLDATLKREDAL
jgi:hypothetical protein